jgi:hypothetical protein
MSNGQDLFYMESYLERLFGNRLIGCGGAKEQARQECLAAGGSEEQCEEEAQRAFDRCMRVQDVLWRIAMQLRGVAAKQLLVDEQRTANLWSRIFNDPEKAMIFSKHLAKAFKESGIELADDETFSCVVFAAKKPEYLSSIVPPTTQISDVRLFQLLEPKIMKAVLDFIEKDKIFK